ncbi:MAG: hypothetical protein J7647_18210 [Cyanobacteria bacterium SBLK]|nr:hypothetical protein [Cyanobacteria bacterium SBLK]
MINSDSELNPLIAELQELGVKHDPEAIVCIAKQADGKIVFLEIGDRSRGLQHILEKAEQFANIGINVEEIPDAIMTALTQGAIIGYQGKKHRHPRPIYEFSFNDETKYISITVASNGYIVGANPRTQPN